MKKKIIFWIMGGAVIGGAMFALYILVTQTLWNALVPSIFDGPSITYWQTAGLLLLACMFMWLGGGKGKKWHRGCGCCGNHSHEWKKHSWKSKWDNKWCGMSEDKEKETTV